MSTPAKRGNVYHFSDTFGGVRYRCSLGVSTPDCAKSLSRQIIGAMSEGARSDKWRGLKTVLPPASFKTLTNGFVLAASSDLGDFQKRWEAHLDRRVKLGEIASSTRDNYVAIGVVFFDRMLSTGVRKMDEIPSEVVEEYLVWRKESMLTKNPHGGARGMLTDGTVLASIFGLAREENLIQSSPLKYRYHPVIGPKGAEAFTPDELEKLEEAATGKFEMPFTLFRWTGLRCSDVCCVTWQSWNRDAQTITWKTKKRKTTVVIPLTDEVNCKLIAEYERVKPDPTDPILFGSTEAKLYRMCKELGAVAGVEDCHPHRFRDSYACTILEKGGTIYDVAKLLGTAVNTAENHYAAFTDQLQNRVRNLLSNP